MQCGLALASCGPGPSSTGKHLLLEWSCRASLSIDGGPRNQQLPGQRSVGCGLASRHGLIQINSADFRSACGLTSDLRRPSF